MWVADLAWCCSTVTKDQEAKHIKQALTTNGYPAGVIQHRADDQANYCASLHIVAYISESPSVFVHATDEDN